MFSKKLSKKFGADFSKEVPLFQNPRVVRLFLVFITKANLSSLMHGYRRVKERV